MSFANNIIVDAYRAREFADMSGGLVPVFETEYGQPIQLKFGENRYASAIGNASKIKGIIVRSATISYIPYTFIEGGFNDYIFRIHSIDPADPLTVITEDYNFAITPGRYTLTGFLDYLRDKINGVVGDPNRVLSYSIDDQGAVIFQFTVVGYIGWKISYGIIFDELAVVTETSPTLHTILGFPEFSFDMGANIPASPYSIDISGTIPSAINTDHRLYITCPSHCPGYRGKINIYDGSGIPGWGTVQHLEGTIAQFPIADSVGYGDVINVQFSQPIPIQFSKAYKLEDVIELYVVRDLYSKMGPPGLRWTVELTFF